jgi:hypothetical protein
VPSGPTLFALERMTSKVPGLRRIPAVRLLALGEIALLARDHVGKLTPEERRRLVALVRQGHGRPSHLSEAERDELTRILAKAEPRLFAGLAAAKLSPVPLPRRVVEGSRRARRRRRDAA